MRLEKTKMRAAGSLPRPVWDNRAMAYHITACIVLATCLLAVVARGAPSRAPLRGSHDRLTFLVFDAAAVRSPRALARGLSAALYAELAASREFTLVNEPEIAALLKERREPHGACRGRDCAVRIGSVLGSDKTVTGTLQLDTIEDTEPVSRYVYRVAKKERWRLTVAVHDAPTGKTELSFTEHPRTRAEIEAKTREIARKIVEYYRKRAWARATAAEPLRAAAVASAAMDASAQARPGVADVAPARWGLEFDSLAASAGYLKPLNAFSNIAHDGYGIAADARWRLVPWRSVVVSLGVAGYRIRDRLESIQSYYLAMALVTAGYSLSPARGLYVVPSLGFGYLGHIIYGDKNIPDGRTRYEYKMHYTYDPSLFAGGELQYALGGRIRLFLAPWYVYFFEKDENGQAVVVLAGVRFVY